MSDLIRLRRSPRAWGTPRGSPPRPTSVRLLQARSASPEVALGPAEAPPPPLVVRETPGSSRHAPPPAPAAPRLSLRRRLSPSGPAPCAALRCPTPRAACCERKARRRHVLAPLPGGARERGEAAWRGHAGGGPERGATPLSSGRGLRRGEGRGGQGGGRRGGRASRRDGRRGHGGGGAGARGHHREAHARVREGAPRPPAGAGVSPPPRRWSGPPPRPSALAACSPCGPLSPLRPRLHFSASCARGREGHGRRSRRPAGLSAPQGRGAHSPPFCTPAQSATPSAPPPRSRVAVQSAALAHLPLVASLGLASQGRVGAAGARLSVLLADGRGLAARRARRAGRRWELRSGPLPRVIPNERRACWTLTSDHGACSGGSRRSMGSLKGRRTGDGRCLSWR